MNVDELILGRVLLDQIAPTDQQGHFGQADDRARQAVANQKEQGHDRQEQEQDERSAGCRKHVIRLRARRREKMAEHQLTCP